MRQEPSERQRSTGPLACFPEQGCCSAWGSTHRDDPPEEPGRAASGERSSPTLPATRHSPEPGRRGRARLGLHQSFPAGPDPRGTEQPLFPLGLSNLPGSVHTVLHKPSRQTLGHDAAAPRVKASAGSGRPPRAAAESVSAVRTLSATLVLQAPPGAQRTAPGLCHSGQAPKDAPPKSQQAAELPDEAVTMSALITKRSPNAPRIWAPRLQRQRLLGHKSEAWGRPEQKTQLPRLTEAENSATPSE